jgi:hypothetical protein
MQRWDWATSQFVQLTYIEEVGTWVWDDAVAGKGHCGTPWFGYDHRNFGTNQNVATEKYRVRTWAKQSGSYAGVTVMGRHTAVD